MAAEPLRIRLTIIPADSPLYPVLAPVPGKGRNPLRLVLATRGLQSVSAVPALSVSGLPELIAALRDLRQAIDQLALACPLGSAETPPPPRGASDAADLELGGETARAPTSRAAAQERLWLAEARAMGQAWMDLLAHGDSAANPDQEDPYA